MKYQYWVLIHLTGVLGLLATHGASMVALYRVRGVAPDRDRIADTIAFSSSTTTPMYVALVLLLIGGVGAALKGHYLNDPWITISIAVLVLTVLAMLGLASPYFRKVRAACALRPSGVPRVSDEELLELVRSPRAHVITAIGLAGLLVILSLMIFKPGLGT
jgi:uncharacterized membrane protein